MIVTTGILLIDGHKFLVGHVTGSEGTPHNDWSIPKGQVDNHDPDDFSVWGAAQILQDEYHQNAFRELHEECNITATELLQSANYTGIDEEVYPNKRKKVICFIYELHTPLTCEIKCNSIVPELNYPEFDDHKWIDLGDNEFETMHPAQQEIIKRYFIQQG